MNTNVKTEWEDSVAHSYESQTIRENLSPRTQSPEPIHYELLTTNYELLATSYKLRATC